MDRIIDILFGKAQLNSSDSIEDILVIINGVIRRLNTLEQLLSLDGEKSLYDFYIERLTGFKNQFDQMKEKLQEEKEKEEENDLFDNVFNPRSGKA